jgi:C-terminal processing protease CtpA/Prc
LAERCGMQVNDFIIKIGSISTEHVTHQNAQELIRQQNNQLELTLQRSVLYRIMITRTHVYDLIAFLVVHYQMQMIIENMSNFRPINQ